MSEKKIKTEKSKAKKAEQQKAIITRYWVRRVLNMTADEIKAILIK